MTLEVRIPYKECLRDRNDLIDDILKFVEENVDDAQDQIKFSDSLTELVAHYWPCADPLRPNKP